MSLQEKEARAGVDPLADGSRLDVSPSRGGEGERRLPRTPRTSIRTHDQAPLRPDPCPFPAVVDSAIPKAWDERLAYVISQVGSPPVFASAAVTVTASVLSSPQAWMWAAVYVFLAILPPLLYLVWLVRRGRVTDLDVQLREQRRGPLIFSIACAGLAWLVLALGAAPRLMIVLAGALWLQMALIYGITLRWKISVHSAAAAGAAMLVWSLVGMPLPFLIGVPAIAWSRVCLGRHTVAQTVAGALLGAAIFLIAFSLQRGG